MQLLEAWGSQKDREMMLVANGTFKNKLFDFSQKKRNEEQKFTLEYSSKESAVITYEKKKKSTKNIFQQGNTVLI